jgi:hypothetical protein
MSHHQQFSYAAIFDKTALLDHMKTVFAPYNPIHIAIGVIDEKTHVYIEMESLFRRDSVRVGFFDYLNIKAELMQYIKNFLNFRKLFRDSPHSVLEEREPIFDRFPRSEQDRVFLQEIKKKKKDFEVICSQKILEFEETNRINEERIISSTS